MASQRARPARAHGSSAVPARVSVGLGVLVLALLLVVGGRQATPHAATSGITLGGAPGWLAAPFDASPQVIVAEVHGAFEQAGRPMGGPEPLLAAVMVGAAFVALGVLGSPRRRPRRCRPLVVETLRRRGPPA